MIKFSVVLVPFPFDDLTGMKARPALCLTNKIGKFRHIVIAFISSNIHQENVDSDIIIMKNSPEWEGTGLRTDSLIRLHKLVTIPKTLIKRRLGFVNSELQQVMIRKLKNLFENK